MQNKKKLRIAAIGSAADFHSSLLPSVIQSSGIDLQWVEPVQSDVLIIGSFHKEFKRYRWIPKIWRPTPSEKDDFLWQYLRGRRSGPITIFLTGENIRYNTFPTDYSISFDLAVSNPKHFRLPYWMEMVDWSHEGIRGNINPRYGRLLSIDRLCEPLGATFLAKPRKAALFASHLREPRKTLLTVLKQYMEVTEFGKHFNPSIRDHHQSGFKKIDVLNQFGFNLCPENGMYPGYYTEKVPEAFMADCLPITWADSNISYDFNPKAFINLAPMTSSNFSELEEMLNSNSHLCKFSEQPLLLQRPTIQLFRQFTLEIIKNALS